MNENSTKVLIPVLTVGLIICAFFLFQQRIQLSALHVQLAEQGEQLEKISAALKISRARQTSAMVRSLPAGVYTLAAEVTVDPYEAEQDKYTIYNFVLDFNVGAVRRKLQFGYGRSGYLTHVVYFDHDSDGRIDTKMMNDFAKEIPGLELAAGWLIEPDHSQAVYDAFRLNVDLAEQLAMDGVTEAADAKIGAMWEWLNGQSVGISEWVEEAVKFD